MAKKKLLQEFPGERQEGTRKGISESQPRPQLSPRAAPARAPAAPARRPEALPLRVRLPAAAPALASRAQGPRFSPHLSSSWGWASRALPTMWVSTRKPVANSWRVCLNGRAPHPCARQAASSGQGATPRGHLPPACKSYFLPFHLEQSREIRGTHPRPSPDRREALFQVLPTPRWALGTAAGLARFPASLRQPQPCLPVLAVHTQKHTTKITSLGIAPKGPGQTGRVEARKKQMRLDAETRRARSRETCWRAAREVVLLRRVPCSGIAPGKAARPPRPQPAPTAGGGTRPGPRPPLRRRSPPRWGGNAGLGHSGRLRLALATAPPPRQGHGRSALQPLSLGALELESRDPGAKREELEAQGTLLPELHALQPGRAGGAAAAVSASAPRWGLPKLPQFILVETKNPEPLRVDSPSPRVPASGGTPTQTESTSVLSSSLEDSYSGFA